MVAVQRNSSRIRPSFKWPRSKAEPTKLGQLGLRSFVNFLGSLSFDRQFGPATLKAMFGAAVVTGFEGQQTVGVSTVNGALCFCIQAIRHQRDYSRKRRASSPKRAVSACEALVARGFPLPR